MTFKHTDDLNAYVIYGIKSLYFRMFTRYIIVSHPGSRIPSTNGDCLPKDRFNYER